ncbi:MAG TPA: hypothetical protein VL197_02460 [Nitrospirota bacterium]|nr:hypothetical protein [Nitrospirota bacterium]
MSSLTYGNGLNGTIGYENQYRITNITVSAVMNLSYQTYDANGNIKTINDVLDATKNKTFTYDALDRLQTAASGIWDSLGWTYDGVGNRQTENSRAMPMDRTEPNRNQNREPIEPIGTNRVRSFFLHFALSSAILASWPVRFASNTQVQSITSPHGAMRRSPSSRTTLTA